MGTLQTELVRNNLSKDQITKKQSGNMDSLLISSVVKNDLKEQHKSIRKTIKEKHPLFKKENAKNGEVKILYKKGEKMREIEPERLKFITILIKRLIGKNLSPIEITKMMDDIPHGKGIRKSCIRNFLTQCKWCTRTVEFPEGLLTSVNRKWSIKEGTSPELIISLYQQRCSEYWKRSKLKTPIKKEKIQKLPMLEKIQAVSESSPKSESENAKWQSIVTMFDLFNLLKERIKIDINVNITLSLKKD